MFFIFHISPPPPPPVVCAKPPSPPPPYVRPWFLFGGDALHKTHMHIHRPPLKQTRHTTTWGARVSTHKRPKPPRNAALPKTQLIVGQQGGLDGCMSRGSGFFFHCLPLPPLHAPPAQSNPPAHSPPAQVHLKTSLCFRLTFVAKKKRGSEQKRKEKKTGKPLQTRPAATTVRPPHGLAFFTRTSTPPPAAPASCWRAPPSRPAARSAAAPACACAATRPACEKRTAAPRRRGRRRPC